MTIVVDSNVLIGLAKGEVFEVLRDIYLPPDVWREVVEDGLGLPGASETRDAHQAGWLVVQAPPASTHPATVALRSSADRECLALAQHLGALRLLSDDEQVRRAAAMVGVPVARTLDVVIMAKSVARLLPFLSSSSCPYPNRPRTPPLFATTPVLLTVCRQKAESVR